VTALVALALAFPPAGALPPVGAAYAQALPDLGDISQVKLSPAQERKLGEAIVREARAQGGILNDPEVNDYLNELGNRLVSVSPDAKQDFDFFAVGDGSINAFALPGGYIGVNTGLILLAQTESELASVLAHEITHVTQRHIARQLQGQQDGLLMSLAALAVAMLAARAGGASSGDAAQAAIATSQALALQSRLNYTREFEYEADRIGFQRLAVAGFDDVQMSAVIRPALTTVHVDISELGALAAKRVLALSMKESAQQKRTTVVLPSRLIVRQSTSLATNPVQLQRA